MRIGKGWGKELLLALEWWQCLESLCEWPGERILFSVEGPAKAESHRFAAASCVWSLAKIIGLLLNWKLREVMLQGECQGE